MELSVAESPERLKEQLAAAARAHLSPRDAQAVHEGARGMKKAKNSNFETHLVGSIALRSFVSSPAARWQETVGPDESVTRSPREDGGQ